MAGHDTTHAATDGRAALFRLVAPTRVVGFALYNFWLLATFYNTYLFMSAPDFREVLYLNHVLSLAMLTITLAVFPFIKKRADKWVLSRSYTLVAGALVTVSTALLTFVDSDSATGVALTVLSSIGTGLASGILFLGWARLYADVGPRLAMLEIGTTWAAAGLLAAAASVAPPAAATAVTVAAPLVSAVLLRKAAFARPPRPQPSHQHRLQRRTRRMFARGLVACAGMGCVSGFSDVLTGFRFIEVPPHYEVLLALSCAVVAVTVAAIALLGSRGYVMHTYRLVTMLLTVGCLLTTFAVQTFTLSNAVVFGAYSGFVILLCTVCIDISNYFDQPATRTFGATIAALYGGELTGIGLGHLASSVLQANTVSLSIVASALTLAVVFANLFLFTEKDLAETSLGEMTDEDSEQAAPGLGLGLADGAAPDADGAAGTDAFGRERRIACITALFVERYALTPREADVLPLIIKGRTIARIQEELHISQGTVSTHTRHIYQKAGVRNRQALLDMLDSIPDEELLAALHPKPQE